jgi:hypothetical protein
MSSTRQKTTGIYWYIFVEIQSRLLCQHIGETPAQEYCFKFTAATGICNWTIWSKHGREMDLEKKWTGLMGVKLQ